MSIPTLLSIRVPPSTGEALSKLASVEILVVDYTMELLYGRPGAVWGL